jgi:hypothetical protein
MKTLLLKAAALALIISAFLALLLLLPWSAGETFRNISKKHTLIGKITGKKIILVGGSGVANGLSAGIIEQHVAGYHAVNMGVNGGLGMQFNINEILEYLKPGDVVILSPEYDNFEGGYRGGVQILKAINIAPFTSRYVTRERYCELLKEDFLVFLQLKAQSYFDGIATILTNTSMQIDDRGDRVSKSASRDVSKMDFSFKPDARSYGACVKLLNDFDKYCNEHGATAILSFPALPSVQYKAAKLDVDAIYYRLIKDITMLVLHPPAETVYDPAYFEDSVYHLGKRGREMRSLDIARLLRTKLPS